MKCVVCKAVKPGHRPGAAPGSAPGRAGWVFTSERVVMAQVQLMFKLFELTRREFPAGSVCPGCFDLVARVDSLEYQAAKIRRALRSRVARRRSRVDRPGYMEGAESDEDFVLDDVSEPEDEDEDEAAAVPSESEEEDVVVSGVQPAIRKRRRRSSRGAKVTKVKREKPDSDPEMEEETSAAEPGGGGGGKSIDVSNYLKVEHHIKHENPELEEGKPPLMDLEEEEEEEEAAPSAKAKEKERKGGSNLDFNVTVTRTTRGHEQLVYEGYTYLRLTGGGQQQHAKTEEDDGGGEVTRWKCSNYYGDKTSCRAKVSTSMDGSCVLRDSLLVAHNHPPPGDRKLRAILFRERVKQIASNHPEMRPAEVLANARALQEPGTEVGGEEGSLGMKDESLVRFIQRVKSKNRQIRRSNEKERTVQPLRPSDTSVPTAAAVSSQQVSTVASYTVVEVDQVQYKPPS